MKFSLHTDRFCAAHKVNLDGPTFYGLSLPDMPLYHLRVHLMRAIIKLIKQRREPKVVDKHYLNVLVVNFPS